MRFGDIIVDVGVDDEGECVCEGGGVGGEGGGGYDAAVDATVRMRR